MSTKVICRVNPKSVVGKTTTVVSLAEDIFQKGRRVLLIDKDTQFQTAVILGYKREPSEFYLPARGRALEHTTFVQSKVRFSGRKGLYLLPGDQRMMAVQTVLKVRDKPISSIRQSIDRFFFRESLHYIILDTASSIGSTLLREQAVWASDLVIVPTATDFVSVHGVSGTLLRLSILQEHKNWRGNLLGLLPAFLDEQTRESKAAMEVLHEKFDASILPPIHRSTLLRECAAEGKTIFEFDSMCRAATEYQALTWYVMKF